MNTYTKIILFTLGYIFLSGICNIIGLIILQIPPSAYASLSLSYNQHIVIAALGAFSAILTILIFIKYQDKRKFNSLGLNKNIKLKNIFLGILIPATIISISTFYLKQNNLIEIKLNNNTNSFSIITKGFILFTLISFSEEFIHRGYILTSLLNTISKPIAACISSFIFMLMHIGNNGINFLGLLNLFLAGIFLSTAYLKANNIWLPTCIHLFWNYIQGSIFGYAISGIRVKSIFNLQINSINILTGGYFGFEGSILCTILIITSIIIMLIVGLKPKKYSDPIN